jgi:uncharacterized protein (TIGR02466 family)
MCVVAKLAFSAIFANPFRGYTMSTHSISLPGGFSGSPMPTPMPTPMTGQSAGSLGGPLGAQPPVGSPFELKGSTVWGTLLFQRQWRDHALHGPGMIAEFNRMKAAQKENIESGVAIGAKSADGLYESTLDLFESTTHPDVKQLARFCASTVRKAVWEVNGREVDAKRIKVEFKDSWYHITNKSGFHDAHVHGGCSWCGIYYVQAGDSAKELTKGAGNGVSRFYSPLTRGGQYSDYGNKYLGGGIVDIPPRDGMLVLFPAYLLHSGLPYIGNTDRILVAFNSATTLTDQPTEI